MYEFFYVRVIVINYSYCNALAVYFLEMNYTVVRVVTYSAIFNTLCQCVFSFYLEKKKENEISGSSTP